MMSTVETLVEPQLAGLLPNEHDKARPGHRSARLR